MNSYFVFRGQNMDKILYFNSMIEPKGGVFSTPVIVVLVIFLILIAVMAILIFGLIDSLKNSTLALTNNELIIKSVLYGRKIPIENILIDEVKAINLNENPEYNISLRTNGARMPGIALGWMRLTNKQKSLVFVTDRTSVILIPTKDFVVLFSMDKTEKFIKEISNLRK